jgi:murein DD-endopeptidase MepM/ murein hydrolase activator NlpD
MRAMVQVVKRRARLLTAVLVGLLAVGLLAGVPAKASPVFAQSDGAWTWPLSPTPDVVAGFHPPTTPYGPGHVGVDLSGWPGQPVTAVADGMVHFAGQVAGTPVVSVVHGAERSTYQPVVASVRRGDAVAAGQAIGTLSNVGGHCLPLTCLHLGRRAGDIYLDPLALLGAAPVRLLPRGGAPVSSNPAVTRPQAPAGDVTVHSRILDFLLSRPWH